MFQIQKLSTQIVKTVESQILFLLSYLRNMLKLSNKPTHTKILEQISRFWQVLFNKLDHSGDDQFYLYYWNEKTTQVLAKVDEIRLLQFLLCDSLYPNINVNAMFISAQILYNTGFLQLNTVTFRISQQDGSVFTWICLYKNKYFYKKI